MKNNFINKLNHYKIIHFAVIGIILCALYPLILNKVWTPLFGWILSKFRITNFTEITCAIFLLFFYLMAFVMVFKEIYYFDRTGRSYSTDQGKYHMRFFELLDYFKDADDNHINAEKELPIENWKNAEGVILGHVGKYLVKRESEGTGNFALFSLPGGGKTTSQIIPSAMRFSGSVLCVDIKGDVLNWVSEHEDRNIKIFAPNDASISCHFDPFAGIKEMDLTSRKSYIKNLGLALLPDEVGENSTYFINGARNFWNAVCLYMLDQDLNTSFIEVVKHILLSDYVTIVTSIKDGTCEEAKEYINSYYGTNEKNVAGVYQKLCETLQPFTDGDLPELLADNDDAITPAMLDDGYDIYIEIPQDKIDMFSPITSIIIQNFMNYFMGRPDSCLGTKEIPILFLLDEFPQLHFNLELFLAAMETLRSKKVSLFIAQQSLASLARKYGEVGSREIIDNCSYISIMSSQDPTSRKRFQELIGTRKELIVGTSETNGGQRYGGKSYSRSVQVTREFIYQPEDFGNLNDRIVIVMNGRYIEADKCKCYE